jgi:hypothetical protein
LIFNLREYIAGITGVKTYANPKDITAGQSQVPEKLIQLIEEPGSSTAWFKFHTYQLQVITRDIDSPKARVLAYIVYNLLDNKFGLELPAINVDGVVYAAIKFAQISANTEPGFLGYDENGLAEYSNTYRFLI